MGWWDHKWVLLHWEWLWVQDDQDYIPGQKAGLYRWNHRKQDWELVRTKILWVEEQMKWYEPPMPPSQKMTTIYEEW